MPYHTGKGSHSKGMKKKGKKKKKKCLALQSQIKKR